MPHHHHHHHHHHGHHHHGIIGDIVETIHNITHTDWIPPSHCRGHHHWERCHGGHVPHDAVRGGQDIDGGPIYVGRAHHEGDLLPAKICPHHGCAYVSWGGQEIRKHDYEVLRSTHIAWRTSYGGNVPIDAIRVGGTCNGEPLYVGRVFHCGALSVGKVHPSHGCLYLPFDGRELKFTEYEILVLC